MAIDAAALRVVVSADTSKAESGLKSFSSKMGNMAGSLASVGGVLSATIGAPLIGIGVSAVKTAADFERSMNVLGYASGATADQMQALSDQALQLGADTVFSANEAAEGMVDLAKAGMDTTEIMGAIPGVMDLAAAGQIAVSDAANLTAAALNTFGLEAGDAAHVADVLAAAANASTADVADLAFGMQNAGAVFASNGQSLESLATMMALLANNGINASDAATSLKTMTMWLTAPTAQAAKVMRQLGINVFDAQGNMRDYRAIIGDLQGATAGLSDAQRDAAFNTIFGADAIRAATILSQEGAAGYEEMSAKVNEQGAAAQMAQAQNQGLAGAMEQISGSIESLMTKLALPFLDTLAGWMGTLTEFVNQIGELPQPVINAALAFAGFAAALGAVLLAAAGIAGIIGALATPIGLVALVVIGLGAAVAALWLAWETNWMNIQGKTEAVMAVITPLLAGLSAGIGAVVTAFSNLKMPTLKDLQGIKDNVVIQLQATVKTMLDPPQLTIKPFPPMTIPPPPVQIEELPKMTLASPEQAKGFADVVGNIIDNLTTTITGGDWAGVGRLLGSIVIAKWNAEVAKIGPFLTFLGIADAFGKAISLLQTNMILSMISFGAALAATGLPEKIAALGVAIGDAVKTMWENLMATIMHAFIAPAPDATSTADVLRERQLGDFSWSKFITPLTWETFVSSLTWGSWVTAISWAAYISSLLWSNFVPRIFWSFFVGDLSWSDFVPFLDWSRFLGGGGGGGSGVGGGQQSPSPSPPLVPGVPRANPSSAASVVLHIENVNIANDMDIEVLAAQLARRFQQKLR